jgi:hypothetical protein
MRLDLQRELTKRRKALREHFGLSEKQASSVSQEMLDQLELCADDDARRVLLKRGMMRRSNLPRQITISEVYGDIEIK